MKLIGYHGTNIEDAYNICKNGIDKNKITNTWPNDLGNGFYAYIDVDGSPFENKAVNNAIEYAKTFRKKDKIGIIKLTLDIDPDNSLILLENKTIKSVSELFDAVRLAAYNKIPKKFKREETYVKAGFAKRNNRDGFLFEYIIDHGLIKEPQVIIEDTHTDFNNVRSNFNNGTEIAIRDLSVIKAKKLLILGKDHMIKESDE